MTLLNDMHEDWDHADDDHRPGIVTIKVGGAGLWSTAKPTDVQITEWSVTWISITADYGEVNVHFNTQDWRPDRDGLIYTDPEFLQGINQYFRDLLGLDQDCVNYTEQGMQGDNYVSMEFYREFIQAFSQRFPQQYQQLMKEAGC